ncbi:MAG: DAK2 domain-containing protein [Anaerolineae bacterium]|nr:DAK2 domain-containing protein [Anaerolineae bacterium]
MTDQPALVSCDGRLLKQIVLGGADWLDANQETVNRLNVFPVPDGDTGTNMALTMRKAREAIERLEESHAGRVGSLVANGALFGARGNSGVILSQWWRGFAEALENHSSFNAELFALACRNAVERSYKAVSKPVEGTILTVTRSSMDAVIEKARTESDLINLFDAKVRAANAALARTPELLPVLRDAGVVDSGGQGFVFILEGMLRALRGAIVAVVSAGGATPQVLSWQEALVPEDDEGYGYDVQFLIHGHGLDVEAIRARINQIGWSALVVGDTRLVKVHVHVHDPGVPISYAIGLGGEIDDVVVENMQRQYQQYVAQRSARETVSAIPTDQIAVVTVAAGDGFTQLFANDLGAAAVIAGGQTMNPSTEDFIRAIQKLPNERIILLPNNPNVVLAARQAAEMARQKQVRVVPSRSIPQGVAAMLEYANEQGNFDLDGLTDQMIEALGQVITGEVTRAVRSVTLDGVTVQDGQFIGMLDDRLATTGASVEAVIRALLRQAGADKRELVTLYYGDTIHQEEADALVDVLAAEFDGLEFQTVSGGQPLYPYIISIE